MMVSNIGLKANSAKPVMDLSVLIMRRDHLDRSIDEVYGVPVRFKFPGETRKRKLFFIEL